MLGCQVDFILRTVQGQLHSFLCVFPGKVINQKNLSFLGHVLVPFRVILNHPCQ